MVLVCRKSTVLRNWYVIERNDLTPREWVEKVDKNTYSYRNNLRISDADIEGSLEEMKSIASAIRNRVRIVFKRCAVDATKDRVIMWSPRNSERIGECSIQDAINLAEYIERIDLDEHLETKVE